MSNTVAKYATTTLQERPKMRPPATLGDHIFIEENTCFTVYLVVRGTTDHRDDTLKNKTRP